MTLIPIRPGCHWRGGEGRGGEGRGGEGRGGEGRGGEGRGGEGRGGEGRGGEGSLRARLCGDSTVTRIHYPDDFEPGNEAAVS